MVYKLSVILRVSENGFELIETLLIAEKRVQHGHYGDFHLINLKKSGLLEGHKVSQLIVLYFEYFSLLKKKVWLSQPSESLEICQKFISFCLECL